MLNICRNIYSQRLISLLSHLIAPNPKKRINTKCFAYILALLDDVKINQKCKQQKQNQKSCSVVSQKIFPKFYDNENSEMISNFEKSESKTKIFAPEQKLRLIPTAKSLRKIFKKLREYHTYNMVNQNELRSPLFLNQNQFKLKMIR